MVWNLSLLKDLYLSLFISPCTGAIKMTAYMIKALSCCVVRGDVVSIEPGKVDVFHQLMKSWIIFLAKAVDEGVILRRVAVVVVSVADGMEIFDLDIAIHVVVVDIIVVFV